LAELSKRPVAHGVFLRKITRSMVELPILPGTTIERGDVLTLVGSVSSVAAAAKDLGYADRPV
jgi:putative transport protein